MFDNFFSNFFYKILASIQDFTILSFKALANVFRRPRYIKETFEQIDIIGVGSLTIIVLTGFFTGGVLALQSSHTLKSFGAVGLTGQLVALSLVRELGPVLTALMLSGRIGSGIASELGSMVVTDQINAMRALGVDPTKKLVTPRVIATITVTPLLTAICDFFGLIGGWLVALFELKLRTSLFWSVAFHSLSYNDLIGGIVKPFFFGFIVSTVGCFYGLSTWGGTKGVGKSTTKAVVVASIYVIAADFFLNKLLIELIYY